MQLVVLTFIACWVISQLLIEWRPQKRIIILAFPLMAVASVVIMFLHATTYWKDEHGPIPVNVLFNPYAWAAAFIYPFVMLRIIKKKNEVDATMKARLATQRAEDEAAYRRSPEGLLEENPLALTAIRHRPEVIEVWPKLLETGDAWAAAFIARLQADPRAEPSAVIDEISKEIGEAWPHSDAVLSFAYAKLSDMPPSTRREFRRSIFVLGNRVDAIDVSNRLIREGTG